MKVTRKFTQDWAYKESAVLYPIDGIPEGFSWFKDYSTTLVDITHIGHLVGFTPGYDSEKLGAMFYKPIVVKKDAPQEVIDMEFKDGAESLLKMYKNNYAKI